VKFVIAVAAGVGKFFDCRCARLIRRHSQQKTASRFSASRLARLLLVLVATILAAGRMASCRRTALTRALAACGAETTEVHVLR